MLRDYYLPRWTDNVAYLKATLKGAQASAPDSFSMGQNWVKAHNRYEMASDADPVGIAWKLFEKYHRAGTTSR